MKTLRQLCAGLILTLALAATSLAGQIDCPGITQQSPEQTSASATSDGDIPCPGMADIVASFIEAILLL